MSIPGTVVVSIRFQNNEQANQLDPYLKGGDLEAIATAPRVVAEEHANSAHVS